MDNFPFTDYYFVFFQGSRGAWNQAGLRRWDTSGQRRPTTVSRSGNNYRRIEIFEFWTGIDFYA
jgi:hypothetical protein